MNESDFPRARPMLDAFFALNGDAYIVVLLEIDQAFQIILLGEPWLEAVAVLKAAANEVTRHAGIKRAVAAIGHEINETARHPISEARRGWPGQARP